MWMEKQGFSVSGGGRGSSKAGKGGRSWVRVVQGLSKQPLWTTYKILNEEIDDLQCYFSKVLEFPEIVMEESWH